MVPASPTNNGASGPSNPSGELAYDWPALRPRRLARAQLIWLLTLSWPVDPPQLLEFVPPGTELDFFDGRTYVSFTAMVCRRLRLAAAPLPLVRAFAHLSLRFYVRRLEPCEQHGVEIRRGVVLLGAYVPGRLLAWMTRWTYHEPFFRLPVRFAKRTEAGRQQIEFSWRVHRQRQQLWASWRRPGEIPLAGTLEHFLTDRHWGYTRWDDVSTTEYHVAHSAWSVSYPDEIDLQVDPGMLCDAWPRLACPVGKPHCMIVTGSEVQFSYPRRITAHVCQRLRQLATVQSIAPA